MDADQAHVQAKALRNLKKENERLEAEKSEAVATATAIKEAENKEEMLLIDGIVKTFVWHKCKFITNEKVLRKVMKYVFGKLPSNHQSKNWNAQEVANYLHTYQWPMAKCLSGKRNYAQSQLRIAVTKYFRQMIDEFGRPITPPAPGTEPLAIWPAEELLKCATR